MKLTAFQTKFLRWLLRLSFTLPFFYWMYLSMTGGLGAQPIVTVNRQTGYVVLSMVIANLWLGVFIRFRWLGPQWIRWVFAERRSLGIASGVYVLLHLSTYFGKEAFEAKAFTQIATKPYLTFGFIAFLMLLVLLFTSNDLSVRKLGAKKWKTLHRGLHVVSVSILAHIFLIEKGNLPLMALLCVPLMPFQLYRLFAYLKFHASKLKQSL